MNGMPESLEQLVVELSRLPGIGKRTAQRLAVHIVRADPQQSVQLARALDLARERIVRCERCFGFAEGPLCSICSNTGRDETTICVVEDPTDVLLIERTATFDGLYHVLGGSLSPIDGVGPDQLTISQLVARVDVDHVREVLVATNQTMSGEATASYLADLMRDRTRITRPASGLPVGSDLEQADELTIGRAFATRRDV